LDHLALGVARDVGAPRPGERIELERGEAAGDRLLRLLPVVVGCSRSRVPAVGADADAIAARPAEQGHDGDAEPLAGQVPQRLLDAAHRAPEIERAAPGREIVAG